MGNEFGLVNGCHYCNALYDEILVKMVLHEANDNRWVFKGTCIGDKGKLLPTQLRKIN